MVSKHFVWSCVLLQGLVASASQGSGISLKKSNDNLRHSQGALSKSEEIPQVRRPSGGTTPVFYDSPCSNRLYDPRKDMIPRDHWRADCP